jgi:urea transport system substrate-binding protein
MNPPIRIGLLHSLTGTMSLSEKPLLEPEQQAIDEINAAGGLLGRRVEPVIADGASDPAQFARAAQQLLEAGVSALFGCWTSASRKAVCPIVEAADSLLWYPVQYEGLEQSECICYTGSCLNQQVLPAVDWMLEHVGPRLFLVGSDYVFPRTAHLLIRSHVIERGGSVVDESLAPLGAQDFGGVIERMRRTRPSGVVNTLNGDSNLAFYRQCREFGVTPSEIPILATSATESELNFIAEAAAGHFACWDYFQSLDTPENQEFLARFHRRHGADRVVSAPMMKSYVQILLWKQAVERAGTTGARDVRNHLPGCLMASPMGELRIEANRHLALPCRIGKLRPDGQFEVISTVSRSIAPLPWLGVESMTFPGKAMVLQSLADFSQGVNYRCLLEQEIEERKKLESALEQANAGLEQNVEERTALLEGSIASLQQEVAERAKVEAAFREASRYARNLIETSLDPLVTISAEGRITDVNTATERITGVRRETLVGTDFAAYFTEPAKAREGYQRVFAEGQVIDYPLAIRHADGGITEVLYNASLYRDEQGRPLGVFAAARDFTEQRHSQELKEQLEAQSRQLEKTESLSRMAGAIAHHFNNQLTGVMMSLGVALYEVPRTEVGLVESLNDAMGSAKKASEVSNLMLTYLGQTQAKRQTIDLSELCHRSLPQLQAGLPADVRLEPRFQIPGPSVVADPDQLQQVLANLVTNASEASGNGPGVIQLDVKEVPGDEIPAKHRFPVEWQPLPETYACLRVADAGCGIPVENLESLFDPFFSTKFTGRGLGLPVALGIVRSHGGGITVVSAPGNGSAFEVFLPIAPRNAPAQPRSLKRPSQAAPTRTILVVEDEPVPRKNIARLLKLHGWSVLTAEDGAEAVSTLSAYPEGIDCVLCDLTMPHMDGWQTLQAFRKVNPGIPFILSSGYSESEVMKGDHAERPQAFLRKPYQQDTLLRTIREALSPRREPMP